MATTQTQNAPGPALATVTGFHATAPVVAQDGREGQGQCLCPQRPSASALATFGDYVAFWVTTLAADRHLPWSWRRELRQTQARLARRWLVRRARHQVKRGDACLMAELIATGDWQRVDRLMDALEER